MDSNKIFTINQLPIGRMMSGSKNGYRLKYPKNFAMFNANIITEKEGKIWFGDLDIDMDNSKLIEVSKLLKENLYILNEMDCRFDQEEQPINILMKRAIVIIKQDGQILKNTK